MRLLIAMTSVLFVTGLTSSGVLAQEGRLEVVEIYSPALEDNLIGDPATREMRVYLPPSYDSGQRRYPVIFVLHGFTQNSTTFARVKGNDDLVASGQMPESIVVYVDGYNRFGGSKYLSSQTIGDYETYIARDIVAFVDSAYRTIPHRENRAIYGFSMGAHGALHLAFTYPEVWSIAVGSAGPYDLGTSSVRNTVANTMVAALAHDWDSYAALLERFTKEATFVLSWAAATIPNPDNPPFFVDLPFVEVDGTIQEPTPGAWERAWDGVAEHSVIHDVDGYLASPGRLRFIGFIHGRNDAQANVEAARELDRKLNDLDVEHTYLEHDGGHVANVDQAFVLISAHLHTLPPEAPTVASVDRDSWVAIAGQPRRLDLRVRLAAPLETMGPAARLMLDVSALGEKGASIALRHVADAEYVGSASITPEQYGRFFLPLVLDTGGGDAYVAHTLQVDVFPADDLVVLNGGWPRAGSRTSLVRPSS